LRYLTIGSARGAQFRWQNTGETVAGEVTSDHALDKTAAAPDSVMERIGRAGLQPTPADDGRAGQAKEQSARLPASFICRQRESDLSRYWIPLPIHLGRILL
jgi:hypothetical protein